MTTKNPKEDIDDNYRLNQVVQLYMLGQQEYNGVKDYPELELKDFENDVQFWIYKQGFEDAVYDQSFKSELDDL